MAATVLSLLVIVIIASGRVAQIITEITCPNYFSYVNDDGNWAGEIQIPFLQFGTNRIDVRFSQRGTQPQSTVGILLPYPDLLTARQSIGRNRPVYFRITLDSSTGFLPKLTKLLLNKQLLCEEADYMPPSTYSNRYYTIFATNSQIKDSNGIILANFGQDLRVYPFTVPEMNSNNFDDNLKPMQPSIINEHEPVTINMTAATNVLDCGIEGIAIPLIHHGITIPRGRYPWLAAIYHKEQVNLNFVCGGSLVSESIIITAAHCVEDKVESQILVSLGRHDLHSFTEEGSLSREIESIRSHREFKLNAFSDADVAILKMKISVKFTTYIRPICIWRVSDPAAISAGEKGFIAGWGRDEHGASMTRYPRLAEAEIVSQANCLRALRIEDLISNRTICAGNRDLSGPCMGDSGGGLMIKRNGHWLLRGVVSLGQRGEQQCDLSQYVVYCDLAKHIDWVLSNLG